MTPAPMFIIGAGRSGTNILRDTLSAHEDIMTWPCDEINLIWRHGNLDKSDDIFTANHASSDVKAFIQKQFMKLQNGNTKSVVLEKTCANSMRVPFIDSIFPNARYIYIVRDGRDVALSAMNRWTASVELSYLAKKLRYAPPSDIPHYGKSFIRNRIHQWRSEEKRQASWGPRFENMEEWVKNKKLVEVCSKQWARCVELSDSAFKNMSAEKHILVKYEDLVSDPNSTLQQIEDWAQREILSNLPEGIVDNIHPQSANGWMKKQDQFTSLSNEIMAPLLTKHGYQL